jgi:hypothetical protein
MFEKCRNSKKQGDAGMGHAIATFTMMGYMVSIPLTDSQDYDLIVEVDGKLYKVQVRTTRFKSPSGSYTANLKMTGGNSKVNYIHKKGNELVYDYLYILADNGDSWFIPKSAIKNLVSGITLGIKYDEYKIKPL